MARRTFDVVDIIEILVHWHAGRNNTEIAASLNVDRKTVRKYVAAAEAAGMAPGGQPLSEPEWDARVREWFPELADTRLRQVTWPAIGRHHEYITAQLKAGVRMSTIWQRLRDEHGLAVSVQSFRRYVAANVPEEIRRSQVVVWNPRPAEAGEQAQIDYGQLGRWWPASRCRGGRPRPGRAQPGRFRTWSTVISPQARRARKWSATLLISTPGRDGFTWRRLSTARPGKWWGGRWTTITRRH